MINNKKILAFDLGNVIFGFDYNIALNKLKPQAKLPNQAIIDILYYQDFTLDFEKGLVSAEDFHLKFSDAFYPGLKFDRFSDVWCDIFFPKEEVIELIKKLQTRYPLYLISNINKLHFDYLYQDYENVFSLFKSLVLSYEVNSVKPEEAIYEYLRKQADTSFDNIVYIDDRQELIMAAKKLGLGAIQFCGYPKLVEDLKNLGIFA